MLPSHHQVHSNPLPSLCQLYVAISHIFIGKGGETGHSSDCPHTRKLGSQIVCSCNVNKLKAEL